MRNKLFIVWSFFTGLIAPVFSQTPDYIITSNYQSADYFSVYDLFNFNINNFSGHENEGKLEIRLVESTTQTPIAHLWSNQIPLKKGINIFSSNDFTHEYFSNESSKSFQFGQPLQSGSFEICITLTILHAEAGQINDCSQLKMSDNFMIHLLIPGDKEALETLNPLLQWYTNSSDELIKYHLVLTPLYPFVEAEDALSHNLKFIEQELSEKQFFYPLSAPELLYGKFYAWQVVAIKNNGILGVSEAWTFTPVQKITPIEQKKDCYRIIARNFNNGNYLYGDVMKFAYQNSTSETMLNYSVHDLSTGKVIADPPRLVLKPGLNKIDLELKSLKGIKEGHQYMVQIINQNNEKYKLTFNPYEKKKMTD